MNNNVKIGIAVVVAVAGIWAYQLFGTATIAVTSEPTGAIVRIDGRQRGITPVERLEVDVGKHRLEVVHSHYADHVESLSLSRGDHLLKHAIFEVGKGSIILLSNPRGAWVEVDGERLPESTPTQVDVASGAHVIAMGQAERHIVEQTHVLKDAQQLEVNFNLNIDPHGSLTISTRPRSAKVEFLNDDTVYRAKVRMQIGEYAVRVSKAGYHPQEFRLKVRYGENLRHVDLDRQYGQLKVAVEPANADVEVTYLEGGRKQRRAYTDTMQVPVGNVQVRGRALGYRTGIRSVALGGKGATVKLALQVMQVDPGRVFQDELKAGGMGPKLIVIPAGKFVMGNNDGPVSEKPARTVTITQPFAVSQFEITVADYLLFATAKDINLNDRLWIDKPDHAMAYVTFKAASQYAQWLSEQTGNEYRIPSEAEWEYVARAGTTTPYFFGDDPEQLCVYANVADRTTRKSYREWDTLACNDGMLRPGPVGSFKPNAFGLYDIYGNVSEWVVDCGIPEYEFAPSDGSAAAEGRGCETHGIRGGSWDSMAEEALSSYRMSANRANDDRGIRIVRTL